MAISFIGSNVVNGTSLNKPAGTADDDIILIFQGQAGATIPTGFTEIYSDSLSAAGHLSYRIANGEGASWSWSNACRAIVHVYRGVDTSDPIMAVRNSINGNVTGNNRTIPDLYFQACDFMAVSFNRADANLNCTVPSGWTQTGQSTGSGGSDHSVGGGRRSFSNTEGLSSQGTWGGNSSGARTFSVALRASGNKALSLRSFSTDVAGSSVSSQAVTLPPVVAAGDLLLVFASYKYGTNASPPSFGTPSGWQKKGSDQTYSISAVVPFKSIGACALYRIATGSDAVSVTTSATVNRLNAVALAFSTGSGGPTPGLPGTMGAANDTSSNTTFAYPAMTLEDYAENLIPVIFGVLEDGNVTLAPPSGWSELVDRAESIAGNENFAVNTKLPLISAANPGAVNGTLSANNRGIGLQLAVGRGGEGLLGADIPEVQILLLG